MLIKIHVFYLDLKGYQSQLLKVMSLYHGDSGMRIERHREDYYDLSNLQTAGEQLSETF